MSEQLQSPFSPAVRRAQEARGSRAGYAKFEAVRGWQREIDDELAAFIAERDSFYFGTAGADGQPYIQHRGGPKGFLAVLDERTVAFADFRGNRQYISVGNIDENDKAFIFLMDYPNRRRIKIWGTAKYVEGDAELEDRLQHDGYRARVERAIVFRIDAWDVNCPQHIVPRMTEAELKPLIDSYEQRISDLETQLSELRSRSEA